MQWEKISMSLTKGSFYKQKKENVENKFTTNTFLGTAVKWIWIKILKKNLLQACCKQNIFTPALAATFIASIAEVYISVFTFLIGKLSGTGHFCWKRPTFTILCGLICSCLQSLNLQDITSNLYLMANLMHFSLRCRRL